jgi:hypothetical protein
MMVDRENWGTFPCLVVQISAVKLPQFSASAASNLKEKNCKASALERSVGAEFWLLGSSLEPACCADKLDTFLGLSGLPHGKLSSESDI